MHDKLLKGLAGLSLLALSACGPATSSGSEQSLHTINQGMGSWSGSPVSLYYGGRQSHTATVLSGGDVLIAGGYDSSGATDTAEIYSSGSWSATTNLNEARAEHAATLISGGQVLVTGGFGLFGVLSSAELYDPTTSPPSWTTLTNSMNEARGGHTSTLLSDGRVMVAGGTAFGGELSSIEVYNPGTGTWDYSPFALNVPHSAHTATLLPSGHVLIAGGSSFGNIVDTVEDCAPGNGVSTHPSCNVVASMNSARAAHTATLLSYGGSPVIYKVLVTGGYDSSFNSQATSELYTISSPGWATTGSLNDHRLYHTASLLSSGKVLVVGGMTQGGGPTVYRSSAELYDPSLGTWATDASMSTGRVWHTASKLSSGNVLVTGGYNSGGNVGTSEEYTP